MRRNGSNFEASIALSPPCSGYTNRKRSEENSDRPEVAPEELKLKNFSSNVVVYPNPSNGTVIVETGGIRQVDIRVFSITGALVWREKSEQNNKAAVTLDLNDLPKGLYLINVESGPYLVSKKLVLE